MTRTRPYRALGRVVTRFTDIPPEADGLMDDKGTVWDRGPDGWANDYRDPQLPRHTLRQRGPWTVTHVRHPHPDNVTILTPRANTFTVVYPDGTRRTHQGTPERLREIHDWTRRHLAELDAILTHLEAT